MMQPGFYNMDCMEALKQFPDKFFDLAIVDPSYGDAKNRGGTTSYNRFGGRFDRYKADADGRDVGEKVRKKIIAWDVAPGKEYFDELFRVSRDQIIWGGNYFKLPPTRCFIVWRKSNIPAEDFSMASIEYAWTSFFRNAEYYESFSSRMKNEPERIHPTQKPVKLYQWQLEKFAQPGMKILDTHAGSASSVIACARMGFECWGFEIDEDYYRMAEERVRRELAQGTLF